MDYPYACEIDIAFPTAALAEQTKQVMQVDKELGDRVTKSFALVPQSSGAGGTSESESKEASSVLRM